MPRLHILGASGSGTTTLGAALAGVLGLEHHDSDDYYWLPTDPPYRTPRPVDERIALLLKSLPHADWVLSGSAVSWARPLEPLYDLIVYLRLDPALRMERLRRRELARYGARIEPGGDMAEASAAFMTWAFAYDTAGRDQRSRVRHEDWLAAQTAPIMLLDSSAPVSALVSAVVAALHSGESPGHLA